MISASEEARMGDEDLSLILGVKKKKNWTRQAFFSLEVLGIEPSVKTSCSYFAIKMKIN